MSNPNVTVDRNKYIGGSDLPTILGLNAKYGTSIFEFAKQKAGIIPNNFRGNEYTKYGQKMEPIIRDYINSVYNTNYVEDTVIDAERGYRGNTDGIDREVAIPLIEIKTFGEELDVDYYTPQCQFYMETFDLPFCKLVGYKRPTDFYIGVDYNLENDDSYFNFEFDENNLVEYVIERDNNLWAKIQERITVFQSVVAKLKENPNMSEQEFNKLFYGTDLIEATNQIEKLELQLSTMKEIENQYKKAKEDLYAIFEKKGILSFETDKLKITKVAPVSYPVVSIDSDRLKEENEEIYNRYKIMKTTNKKGYILITPRKETK